LIIQRGRCKCPTTASGASHPDCYHRPPTKTTHHLAYGVVRITNRHRHMKLLKPEEQLEIDEEDYTTIA